MYAIEMARMCLLLNALPLPGGLFDQDARDVFFMQVVASADNEKAEIDRKAQEEVRKSASR